MSIVKGIVLEAKDDAALVLTKDGQFVRVFGLAGPDGRACKVGDEIEVSVGAIGKGTHLRAAGAPDEPHSSRSDGRESREKGIRRRTR